MITPNSKIVLLKTPMELDEANTLTFSSENAKYTYFNSLTKLELEKATYQRENGVVRYPTTSGTTYEDLIKYNYCMYQNTSYDSKWFYAFIENISYINDGMCEIKLKTDAFMTWQNDITYKASYIERQHVNDDTIGKHLIPENVETGEYVCNSYEGAGIDTAHCVIMSSWNPIAHGSAETEWEGDNAGSFINGIYQGCDFFVVGPVDEAGTISYFMKLMANQSKLESVIGLFMLPDELISYSTNQSDYTWLFHPSGSVTQQYPVRRLTASQAGSSSKLMVTKNITKNHGSLNGYTPKNNKLYTSQFNYLMVSNNNGANFTYNYEDFSTTNCEFRVDGAVAPGGSIKCFPRNYRGCTNGVEYGIVGGKYPICSFTGDMYTNWLTQNSVNFSIGNYDFNIKPGDSGLIAGGLSILGGMGLMTTGGGALAGTGAILSGGMQIANSIGEMQRHEKQPPMFRGNVNAGDVTYAQTWLDFTFYKMSVKYSFAKMIDDYFTMYGYKVNSLEVINPHKRTYFDYIKTIGCNITGNIPQGELLEIKSLFDRGITLWHNTSHFLDYSVNNTIVS